MKIKEYLFDKLYLIFLSFFISSFIVLFLMAVQTSYEIIIIILILFWFFTLFILLYEFHKRYRFYNGMQATLESLDKKYLITEIMKHPSFLDGEKLFEYLAVIDKSMLEAINIYKLQQSDYKEYIEMWVHEVKTPLAASRLILANNPNIGTKSVEDELDKVEGFVEQALFYARSSIVEKDYMIKEILLTEMIHKVIKRNAKAFIYRNIQVHIHDTDQLVYSDTKWIEFILNQIFSNSLKYMDNDKGILELYTEEMDYAILLYIKDNGVGINAKDIGRIFEKGFTGSNGRRNEKATGMGLFLCKTLCEKLYLNIAVESANGTTICITFPKNKELLLK